MVRRRRELTNNGGNGSQQKYVRGPSTLPKVFNQPEGSKLQLTWNQHGQPSGPLNHAGLYSESLGVTIATARKFDWTKHWDQQDPDHKDWLWDEMNKYWELDDTRKAYTLGPLSSDEFRNKKTKWKKGYYTPFSTHEERIKNKPEQLSQQEWIDLVQFWDTPEHQLESESNKANHAKQMAKHTNGRMSFPTLREKIAIDEGAPPNDGDFFLATHISRRTNGPLDELSRRYIDQMRERAGIDEHGNHLPLTNDIYREVMPPERHGRVRLMGRGVTPTCLSRSGTSSHGNSSSRITELENEIAEMKRVAQEKEEERQRELDEIKQQAKEKEEERQRELSEIKRQAQEKEEDRQREFDEMKRQMESQNREMEARLMKRMLEMTASSRRPSKNTRRA